MLAFSVLFFATTSATLAAAGVFNTPGGVREESQLKAGESVDDSAEQQSYGRSVFVNREPKYAGYVQVQPVHQPQSFGQHGVVGAHQQQVPVHYQARHGVVSGKFIQDAGDAPYHYDQGFPYTQRQVAGFVPESQQVPVQARHHVPGHDGSVGVVRDGPFHQAGVASGEPAARAKIVQQDTEVNFDGSFHNVWNSDNGISVQEQGSVKHVGDSDVAVQQGAISYVDNDGNRFQLNYVADENGFHVEGDHIPTPPPIPAVIARSLEFIAAHPYVEATTVSELRKYHHRPTQSTVTVEDN